MYKVVEFDPEQDGGGGISVVRTEWLTPLKKQCLWPPSKLLSKFNKALQGGIIPDEKWTLYGINRIFYETDNLTKAREKCRKAESESEVASEWEGEKAGLTRKRKIRKIINSDSDDHSDNENGEQVQVTHLPVSPKNNLRIIDIQTFKSPSRSSTSSFLHNQCIDSPETIFKPVKSVAPNTSPLSILVTPKKNVQPLQEQVLFKVNNSLDVIANHLAHIDNELKELREAQHDILMRLQPSNTKTPTSLPPDITIPCEKIEDLQNVDICLTTEGNEDLLINYLSYVGGNKTSTIVRRILEKVFTNSFALNCNWTGRNNKIPLKDYKLLQVIKCAVRKNKVADTATDSEINAILSNWFRFAKDRDGGRERRRSSVQ